MEDRQRAVCSNTETDGLQITKMSLTKDGERGGEEGEGATCARVCFPSAAGVQRSPFQSNNICDTPNCLSVYNCTFEVDPVVWIE